MSQPRGPGPEPRPAENRFELLTRVGCHLCDQAHALLQAHGITPRMIDIDQHPELCAQYNECVPVLRVDGKVRFRGRIDPALLRRLLSGATQ